MDIWTAIGWGIVILIVLIAIGSALMTKKRKEHMDAVLENMKDFTPTQKFIGEDGLTGIAVDERRKTICLMKSQLDLSAQNENEQYKTKFRIIGYKDILQVSIAENGVTVTYTSRVSQLGGALLGDILAGGVGAIIGGLSGTTVSSSRVNRMDLRIIVNDTKEPDFVLNFLNTEHVKNGSVYRSVMDRANHWYSLISVLIKYADQDDEASRTKQPLTKSETASEHPKSIADELTKLAALLDRGLITQEEFNAQKRNILSPP